MEKAKKSEIISKFARKDGDVGSSEVQIALLSGKIAEITEHMRTHKKDTSTHHGLMAMVSRRKRLLKYLSQENHEKYVEISEALGLRGLK